jgi:hypothetical protein
VGSCYPNPGLAMEECRVGQLESGTLDVRVC